MGSETTPAYKRDLHPGEFVVLVFLGCLASALLSWLEVAGWVSLVAAGGIMLWLATRRWQIARENQKDYQSLEAFAEDIYLLGYLITLAALIGIAPRLMSEEKNLFRIAGLKLITTVLGLALMMVFRQTARRWAEEKESEEVQRFKEQQKLFSEAVAKLNDGANQLTAKLDEVVHWFDPKLLEPLSEWSNRAAGAFSAATAHLEAVPGAVLHSLKQLQCLADDLGRVRAAAGEVAGVLTAGTAQAANVLATELGTATQAASGMVAAITALTPAATTASGGIGQLGTESSMRANELDELGKSFRQMALEIAKVERALKKMAATDPKDLNAPMNRLAEVVEAAGEKATLASKQMEVLKTEMQEAASGSRDLASRLGTEMNQLLVSQSAALQGLQDRLEATTGQIGRVAQQMEEASARGKNRDGFETTFLEELSSLHKAMGDAKAQLVALNKRIEVTAVAENRSGILGRLFGGGGSGNI